MNESRTKTRSRKRKDVKWNARFKVKSKIFKMNEPSSSESSPDHNLTDMGKLKKQVFVDHTGPSEPSDADGPM